MKTFICHGQAGAITEIVQIESERSIVFDIDQLRAQYGQAVAPEREMPSTEESSDIQKALNDFKKRYEDPR